MASTFSNLKIELIGTGEQAGTWGTVTNTNLGTALEEAIVGRATANFTTDADLTITLTNSNATQTARNYVLNVTSSGALTATRNLIVPTINKPYIIENNTTGAQSIVVKTSAGTGITVPTGKRMMVYTDGTNVVSAFDNLPAGVTIGGSAISGASTTETLTNKTISADSNTLSGIAASSFVLSNGLGNIDGAATQKVIPSGVVVGTTDTQTITNKTISADSNTLSGVAASSFVVSDAAGNIDGAAAQKAIPSGVVVGTTDTQTLTNKRITDRVVASGTTTGTINPTSDTADVYTMLGLTGSVTVGTPTGAPTNGQKLVLRIRDNGTARTLGWTTTSGAFRVIGTTLPTTTVISKLIYVGCIYNSTDTYWDVVAVTTQV